MIYDGYGIYLAGINIGWHNQGSWKEHQTNDMTSAELFKRSNSHVYSKCGKIMQTCQCGFISVWMETVKCYFQWKVSVILKHKEDIIRYHKD